MNFFIRSIGPALLLSLSPVANAQWSLPASGCSIRYAYDAAGGRTARYWYCWSGLAVQNPGIADANFQMAPIEHKVVEQVLEFMELDLFPNPSSDGITISLSDALDNGSYDVYDAHGRSMLHGKIQGSRLDITTTGIPSGLYNFCLVRGQEMMVRAFVVEH